MVYFFRFVHFFFSSSYFRHIEIHQTDCMYDFSEMFVQYSCVARICNSSCVTERISKWNKNVILK